MLKELMLILILGMIMSGPFLREKTETETSTGNSRQLE
jgi:hypothetical protein